MIPKHNAFWSASCPEADTSFLPASETCYGGPENIRVMAVVIPELCFRDVERQVLGANLVEAANNGPLKQGPEALNRVCMDGAHDVLLGGMLDVAMGEAVAKLGIGVVFVCGQQAHL